MYIEHFQAPRWRNWLARRTYKKLSDAEVVSSILTRVNFFSIFLQ